MYAASFCSSKPAYREAEAGSGVAINCRETRAIVESFVQADSDVNLAKALERLQQFLGSRYDEKVWGKLLESVDCEPGGSPLMDVDFAFQFHGQRGEGAGRNATEEDPMLRKRRTDFY